MNTYMTPPAITPFVMERIEQVRAYAFEHRETVRQFNDRISTRAPGPRDREEHQVPIPIGYTVVYYIVQDSNGWNQIFEIGVAQPKMSPAPGSVARILEAFGVVAKGNGTMNVLQQATKVQEYPVSATHTVVNLVYPFNFDDWNKRTAGRAEESAATA